VSPFLPFTGREYPQVTGASTRKPLVITTSIRVAAESCTMSSHSCSGYWKNAWLLASWPPVWRPHMLPRCSSCLRQWYNLTGIHCLAVASKQHVTVATVTHATTEELLGAMFYVRSVQKLYLENRNRWRVTWVLSC
jgi:hypothetical protein